MTNKDLLKKGRTLRIDDNAEWLVEDRIVLVCYPSDSNEAIPDKYALLFHDNMRVGVVYFMGSYDIHVLVFPEHRGKGYMSHFMRSGVIGLVEPNLKMTTIDLYRADSSISKHLAKLAGLLCCYTDQERAEFQRRLYDEYQARLDAPCSCGSGKKYKHCCRDKDDLDESRENQPCWECNAYKSHTTATRYWKCRADY